MGQSPSDLPVSRACFKSTNRRTSFSYAQDIPLTKSSLDNDFQSDPRVANFAFARTRRPSVFWPILSTPSMYSRSTNSNSMSLLDRGLKIGAISE